MSNKTPAVTGLILAGGKSRRFGTNKALSLFRGERLIERLLRSVREVTDDLLIVTNTPDEYAFLGLRMIPDIIPDCGSLGGIYTGLMTMSAPYGICIACDMPFVRSGFLRQMVKQIGDYDVVIPVSETGYEPLCAVYKQSCTKPIEANLEAGQLKITRFFDQVRVRELTPDDSPLYDPRMFFNVNTPEEYAEALKMLEEKE